MHSHVVIACFLFPYAVHMRCMLQGEYAGWSWRGCQNVSRSLNAAKNLSHLRAISKLKQQEFADLIGLKQFDISRLKAENASISSDKLGRIHENALRNAAIMPRVLDVAWFHPTILNEDPSLFSQRTAHPVADTAPFQTMAPPEPAPAPSAPSAPSADTTIEPAPPLRDRVATTSAAETVAGGADAVRLSPSAGISAPERLAGFYLGVRMSDVIAAPYHFEALTVECGEDGSLSGRLFRPSRRRGFAQEYSVSLRGTRYSIEMAYEAIGGLHDCAAIYFAPTTEIPCESLYGVSVHISSTTPPRLISTPALYIRAPDSVSGWVDLKHRVAALPEPEKRELVDRFRRETFERTDVRQIMPE